MDRKCNGYLIRFYNVDHPPYHAHIFKDGRQVAKYDFEGRKFMPGSVKRHRSRIRKALKKLGLI